MSYLLVPQAYTERLKAKINKRRHVADRIYFVNSGSEANDLAMQMVRCASGVSDIYALRNGYHGMGTGAGSLTSLAAWRHERAVGGGEKGLFSKYRSRSPSGKTHLLVVRSSSRSCTK